MTITTELPTNHVALRAVGYRVAASQMIGRLTSDEFNLCDAIHANIRAGVAPTATAVGLTIGSTTDAAIRRIDRARESGLLESTEAFAPFRAFVLSGTATRLFAEALALMDAGKVAA